MIFPTRNFLLSCLKLFNFLLLLSGLLVLGYSCWMYREWKTSDSVQSTSSSSPSRSDVLSLRTLRLELPASPNPPLLTLFSSKSKFRIENDVKSDENEDEDDSAPWFIYICFGFGFVLTSIPLVGAVSAEVDNPLLFTIYQYGLFGIIFLEGILIGLNLFDDTWEEDFLPPDPTGEVEKAEEFLTSHLDFCKWIAIGIISIELVNLLLVVVLRAMAPNSEEETEVVQEAEGEPNEEMNAKGNQRQVSFLRRYLLEKRNQSHHGSNKHTSPNPPTKTKSTAEEENQKMKSIVSHPPSQAYKPAESAIYVSEASDMNPWKKRMLERYGLDINQFKHSPLSPRQLPLSPCEIVPTKRKNCSIM